MLAALFTLMRPRHWVKNVFVLLPTLFARLHPTASVVVDAAVGFAAFCALSSAVYCFNDVVDYQHDALHPAKRARPIPSGRVTRAQAMALAAGLAAAGLALAAACGPTFLMAAAAFVALNLGYCLHLKNHAPLDVMVIAAGFIVRMVAGGELIGIQPSTWIIAGTGLAALFLALSKRRDDLVRDMGAEHRPSLVGYNLPFLDAALLVVMGAGLLCYILYTIDPAVAQRLGTQRLFYTVPFVVGGILRYLQIIYVLDIPCEPTGILWTDRFLQWVVGGWAATFMVLVYS